MRHGPGVYRHGRMGKPMARHLLQTGHHLTVYDVRQEATAELVQAGAA